MPQNKDLKRLVRTRMKKTGESFTAARAAIVPTPTTRKSLKKSAAPRSQWPALAGQSDATMQLRTGHTWVEWVNILDAVDADKMIHGDITTYLHEKHQVPGWWTQCVAVGYERIRGLREVGQRMSGLYDANKSRTFAVDVETLYAMFSDARRRAKWLPEGLSKIRKSIPNKSIRAEWEDGTRVQFYFVAKGAAKCTVAVQHERLPSKSDIARVKKFWEERLAELWEVM